jgi:hypothetical protein
MITQAEFDKTIADFDTLEPTRGPLYGMSLNLLTAGYEIEAYLMILATWNFANFRYILTTFDLAAFRNVIDKTQPIFERLHTATFQTADINALSDDIKSVYAPFKNLVGQTGAAKILHFKHPGLFVMWDTNIRSKFKINNQSTPGDYIAFLKTMKSEFGHLQWDRKDKTFAKGIDEYNFVIAHRNRKQKKKSPIGRTSGSPINLAPGEP